MYQPAHFREDRLDVQHDLIRRHPLGLLITAASGGLMANPIPFALDAAASEHGTLRAHLSRANPQVQELAVAPECLIVFQGPQAYITPAWYATKGETGKVVPTWNYATVHAWGRPRLIEDPRWLLDQLHELTHHQEGARSSPWQVSDAPETYIAAQLKGIVGIEIVIERIEGKWKVSQNRPEQDRRGVFDGLREQGEAANDMAELVARYGKLEENA
ncbi:MAG: FMN-binding negative transcriptional regulator [Anaerolineae bacterium]